jgi:hypothetical protein
MGRAAEWKKAMRLTIVAVALLAAAGIEVNAQEGRQWIGIAGPDGASLLYGTPQSDDIVIGFRCERATDELVVSFRFEPVGAADGMEIDMELFSEGSAVVLPATGERMLLDDAFVLEARTELDPALRRIITEGETLSVMVQDGVEEIPLDGAAEEAAALFEACG